MTRSAAFLLGLSLVLLLQAGAATATDQRPAPMASQPFAKAELFFELNDSDKDLGIHGEIDGEPWTFVRVEGPDDRVLLDLQSAGRLRQQGMTQLAFESAEPPFDEMAPADFFRRFPEGWYEIEGRSQEGSELESVVWLSHVLADRPRNILVSEIPSAEGCEAPVLPTVAEPVTIQWDPVTSSHPEVGRQGAVVISRYQLFVEQGAIKFGIDLPPTVTTFVVPAEIASFRGMFKFEIIARTSTGNNTAVENCFIVQ
jgi:hypothetical protein